MLNELSKRMGDAVRRSIRRGDALTQYGRGQYLVLLVNTTRENCVVIQKRINDHFIIGRQRSSIQYYVSSMFWEPEHRKPEVQEKRP
jgi:GGDEF domain-containing protein